MKRKSVVTIAIVTLLFVLMMWSFGSSAANKHENPAEQNPGEQQSSAVFQDQDQDEKEPDADLGRARQNGASPGEGLAPSDGRADGAGGAPRSGQRARSPDSRPARIACMIAWARLAAPSFS